MATFSTVAGCSYVVTPISSSFCFNKTILNFVNIILYKLTAYLECTAFAFWAFFVSHSYLIFMLILSTSSVYVRSFGTLIVPLLYLP